MTAEQYRKIRERLGTQGEVAKKLGVRLNTVSRRELGESPVTREAELAIRYLFDKTKNQLKRPGAAR